MQTIMSRRKQSNPKPLLKSDCENSIGEMGILRGQDEEYLPGRPNQLDDGMASSEINVSVSPSSTETTSQSFSNCSSPPLSPIEMHENTILEHKAPQISQAQLQFKTEALPKLRLNAILASDPALQPEAKDIKCMHASNENKIIQDCDQDMDEISRNDNHQQPPSNDDKTNKFPSRINETSSSDVISRVPGFMCGPCGIKFSSLSTLEAHQTYYCTHSRKDADETNTSSKASSVDDATSTEPSTKCIRTGKQYACNQCSYSADKKVSLNRHMRMHQSSPTPSSVTSNGDDSSSQIQQIDRYCTDCDIRFSSTKTYRAHKQHYCSSRHRDGSIPTTATKSSISKGGSQSPPESAKSPATIAPPQPYLALPTNPIVIIPYSLIRGASVLPGPLTSVSPGTTNPDLTCFLLKNGSLHPIAQALTIPTQPDATNTRAQTPNSNSGHPPTSNDRNVHTMPVELLKSVRKKENCSRESTTTPLDLSVRRLSTELLQRERSTSFSSSISGEHGRINIEMMMEGKENLSIDSNSVTPEQIVCAPSLPGSPPLTPSPKRSSHSPRGILSVSPNSMSSSHQQQPVMLRPLIPTDLAARLAEPSLNSHPPPQILDRQNVELTLRLSSTSNMENSSQLKSNIININKKPGTSNSHALGQPQIFVKQGVSKCKECNIVFCKYENYLAHKKHYCSARNLDDKDGTKASPPASPLSTNSTGGTALAYQQLICAACGIKFTSLDNLSAHQMYYCPKRIEIPIQAPAQKEKCSKCKSLHEPGQQCVVNHSHLYKCPICDVVSSNAAESRRHIETHAGVKAFRCSICRYKGNTLRGMRTHIRMHFDKKSSDFNEEHYISCILEEDGVEIPPVAQITQESVQSQLHCCDKCNYSSSYKGNVVRHIKLVHSQSQHHSTSPSLGEGGESLIHIDDLPKQHPSYSVIIKTEPTDDNKSSDIQHIAKDSTPLKLIKLEKKDPIDDKLLDRTDTGYISPERNTVVTATEPKYCNICDIKFNYLNTFIAHKKFYCKNSITDIENSPANSTQTAVVVRATETPV